MDEEEAISLVRAIENHDRRLICGMNRSGDVIYVYAGADGPCIAEILYPEDWCTFLIANPSLDKFFV